jgi:hypothetical protein
MVVVVVDVAAVEVVEVEAIAMAEEEVEEAMAAVAAHMGEVIDGKYRYSHWTSTLLCAQL